MKTRLIFEYEAMSQKGTVVFFEKAAYLLIAMHYHEQRNPNAAMQSLNQAIERFDLSLEILLSRAIAHLDLGQSISAEEDLALAVQLADSSVLPAIFKAEALLALATAAEARDWLMDWSIQWLDNNPPEIYHPGNNQNVLTVLESYIGLFDSVMEVVTEDPTNDDALEQLWVCTELSGRHHESSLFHQQLVEENPYTARAWFNLGHAFLHLGQYDEALEALEYAFIIRPDFEQAYSDFSELALRLGRFRLALQACSEMYDYYPQNVDLLLQTGECYEGLMQPLVAKIWYRKAFTLYPDNPDVLFSLGRWYLRRGKAEKALQYLDLAVDQNSAGQEEYFRLLGDTYMSLGKHRRALKAYQTAVDLAPDSEVCWHSLTEFYFSVGKYRKALSIITEALDFCDHPPLLYAKAACALRFSNRKKGFNWLQQAIDAAPEQCAVLFDWMPELKEDREILAFVMNYYKG